MLKNIFFCFIITTLVCLHAQNDQMMRLTTPNNNHAELGSLVGFWDAKCSVYDGQGTVLYEETGFCENKWILGNRFVLLEHMFPSFHTAALVGYDNFLQLYTAAHIDSEASGIHHFAGTISNDSGKKSFVLRGESIGFNDELVSTIYVLEVHNSNHYKLNIYYEIDEKHVKVIEIDFRRLDGAKVSSAQNKIGKLVASSFARTSFGSSNKLQPLNSLVGEWKVESLIFDDAGNILRVAQGESSNRWIMMQNFVMSISQMDEYESLSIIGYDKIKKVYVAAQADNMGTSIYHCEGGKEGKAFKMFGTAMDYATGEKTELTQTITIHNASSYSCEMYRERDKVGLGVSTLKMDAKRIQK